MRVSQLFQNDTAVEKTLKEGRTDLSGEGFSEENPIVPYIEKLSDKRFAVRTKSKVIREANIINFVFLELHGEPDLKTYTNSGKLVPKWGQGPVSGPGFVEKNPRSVVFEFDDPKGAEERLKKAIERAVVRWRESLQVDREYAAERAANKERLAGLRAAEKAQRAAERAEARAASKAK